jgi:hypothetical protein
MIKPGDEARPSMSMAREIIESAINDQALLKRANRGKKPNTAARQQIRTMMSRYWDNASLLSLDLVGAVMRQGVFIQKMYKVRHILFKNCRSHPDY